jgi:L,D-transpeptidase-like protein
MRFNSISRFHQLVASFLLVAAAASTAHASDTRLLQLDADLAASAPRADPAVIALATHALACASQSELLRNPNTLSVIDYSRPSTEPRLWVFDLARHRLLFEELVAHGRNTGDNAAVRFSNAPSSLMSSIGVFLTGDTYVGHNGYSLHLQGLDAGFNDNAFEREIVIHGASYVDPAFARSQGRLGRSFGCPAVRPAIARPLIDSIRDGSLVVAYYPDQSWLRNSTLIHGCDGATLPDLGPPARANAGSDARSSRRVVRASAR